MTTSELHQYEVWLMWVEFPDHPGVGKVRPVVITDLESDGLAGIVVKITSNTNYQEATDELLEDWAQEGLLKPSVARCSQEFMFECMDLKRMLGSLTAYDAQRISSTMAMSRLESGE